ncbi:TetR/AcrR family transcriptional regulator [Streptomyces sp. ICBB 8177]|uniref:TetR/AcrR family transcriptional regulator n=1 Tax=Streptomyces sp. ICBB 8177 TaxID=563922 RepID=UPI000D67E9B0|nr:TetR/AcrR family transcriptional regulator [Streptomyces sp. ICBB 8177]PWI41654.1 TetR family transcriptional regulator [Streptomyces sp. ICBB 8177]
MPEVANQPRRRYAGKSAAERRAERRERLLEAGLQLFGGGPGYRAASVSALCETAGLSTRQFYQEFHNLEEVLAVLHGRVNDLAEQAAVEALTRTAGQDIERRATAAFRAYAASVTADPRRVRLAFVEVVGVSPQMERRRLERRTRWAELIHAELMAVSGGGEAASRAYRVATTAFVGAVNGLVHDWSAGYVDATLDEMAAALVNMLVNIPREPPSR